MNSFLETLDIFRNEYDTDKPYWMVQGDKGKVWVFKAEKILGEFTVATNEEDDGSTNLNAKLHNENLFSEDHELLISLIQS